MKRKFLLFVLLLLTLSSSRASVKLDLIPYPNQILYEKGKMSLSADAPVEIKGISDKALIDFLINRLPFSQKESEDLRKNPGVTLELLKDGHSKSDEGYQLIISKEGVAIKAHSPKGLLYGVSTLNQILYQTRKADYYQLPLLSIDDVPAYPYRGFMLDASRHKQSVQTVKAILDFMAGIKLNAFHWHLSDDQGWRIESRRYPRLNQVSSYAIRSGDPEINGYYTIDEIHEILKYAQQRNITVIPEFDIPGHSWAILNAYPEFRCPNAPGSNAFCAGNEGTLPFIESLYDEIIEIFHPEYIHIGGDEREKGLWDACPLCRKKMQALHIRDENKLQNVFLNDVVEYLNPKHVTTIAWAENLKDGIPANQIIQSWRLEDETITALRMGHRVIVSYHKDNYLDYPENKKEKKNKPSWMFVLSTEKVYSFDFVPKEATPQERGLVLGGECPLWTESITEKQIYPQIKRRIEAHAERSWTKPDHKDLHRFLKSYRSLSGYFGEYFSGIE